MQHAGNRAVVNRFVGIYRLGIVLLDDVIDLSELVQALADIGVAVVGRGRIFLGKYHSQKTAGCQKEDNKQGSSLRTTDHRGFSFSPGKGFPGKLIHCSITLAKTET